MSELPQGSAPVVSVGSWQPKSLDPSGVPALGLRWRLVIFVLVVLFHVLVFGWLTLAAPDDNSHFADDNVLIVNFIDRAPAADDPQFQAVVPRKDTSAESSKSKGESRRNPEPKRPTAGVAKTSPAPATEGSLQIYNRDGSVRTPSDMLDQIDRAMGDKRVFSYQIPHLDDAEKYFYRNQALTVETTRFEKYWRPDQDLLTDILTRLVEATTKEIKIPVPGHPGSKMVCRISVLAFGGGCGVLTNGSDYVGPLDDPATLNPEEDRQCQAWWEQIIGAKTQELWRKTRALYEAQCRKPLARLPSG